MEKNLDNIVSSALGAVNMRLWGIEHIKHRSGETIRVFIDKDQGVTVDDCEQASRQISSCLDIEDIIPNAYDLEVSSPGLDCKLFAIEQYTKFLGCIVKLRTFKKIDNRRNFQGKIAEVSGDNFILHTEQGSTNLCIQDIEKAKIISTT